MTIYYDYQVVPLQIFYKGLHFYNILLMYESFEKQNLDLFTKNEHAIVKKIRTSMYTVCIRMHAR